MLFFLSTTAQNRSDWFEFYLPWDDSTKTVTDMSAYLDPPAGKYGFLQVTPDGHFRFENKLENERFVGVVNVAIANFPSKEEAPLVAARMAKFGINLVRIHLMDVEGQYGLFLNSAQNTLQISPVRLDKMDYFIKCLKDRGIYFNFCVQSGRMYKTADGIAAPVTNDQSKYVTLFDRKIIDLQKDFAQKTIGHKNPYTGLTYAADPAMANMELTNENSLFNGWLGWQSDFIFEGTTGGIGAYYSHELDTLFNDWLARKYENTTKLREAWSGGEPGTSAERIKNGSFEQNLSNWSSLVTGGAQGKISVDTENVKDGTKSAKIVVTAPGAENWNVQLKSNEFKVEKNKAYKISFYAKADVEKDVRLEIMENQTWKWIDGPFYKTSAGWKKYELFFNSPFNSDALIVAFEWGKQTGTFWLDSVSISETYGVGLEPGESLEARNISRTRNSEIGKYTNQRVRDNAEFYFDTEKHYTGELSGFLKNDLNVKCPVTFTNNYYGLASIYSQSQADYMDFHMYWDHPGFPNGWSDTDFTMRNQSVLLNPENSTFNHMMLSRVKNMPLVLSEYNHPYPYIFQVEAPSLLYAYGSFFDLDAILWHAYYDYMNHYDQRGQDMFFDIAMHPVMMTQLLLALPYRMKSIEKSRTVVEANYRRQDVFNNLKIFRNNEVINFQNAEYGTSFLEHGFAHASFNSDSSYLAGTPGNPGKVVTTDTGELTWDGDNGYFTVNNPFWQGATGYLGNKTIGLGNISISGVETTGNLDFAAIHLISLDSLPIGKSRRMLLLTSARVENEGLQWNTDKTRLMSSGGTRALCEPVAAMINFNGASVDSFLVYQLNERGQRIDSLPLNQLENGIRFSLNKKTLWYEIANHKFHDVPQENNTLKKNKNISMKIRPNPGRNYSTIEYSFPENSIAEFVLYNSMGEIIRNEPVEIARNQINIKRIDLKDLKPGIYYCGFHFHNGTKIMDKLVVSN